MLFVQKYLSENSLKDLEDSYEVYAKVSPCGNYTILDYTIFSPNFDPMVEECRGLVLNSRDWSVAGKSFNRFYNYGQHPKDNERFNGPVFITEKVDGTLINLWYDHLNKEWKTCTRFTYGDIPISSFGKTASELFWSIIDKEWVNKYLDPNITYACELCTPFNRIVTRYDSPRVYILGMFDNKSGDEHTPPNYFKHFKHPFMSSMPSMEYVHNHLSECVNRDVTFEGFVISNSDGFRTKLKSAAYCQLHKMAGNGFTVKSAVELIKDGKIDDVSALYPEFNNAFSIIKDALQKQSKECWHIYQQNKNKDTQKEFALAVKQHKMSHLMFQARKLGIETADQFHQLYLNSNSDMILDTVLSTVKNLPITEITTPI